MSLPEDTAQTMGALEEFMYDTEDFRVPFQKIETPEQTTEDLEQLPRIVDRRSFNALRRHTILQQKQTDPLPQLATDTPVARGVWRQVIHLREENRRLRYELNSQRSELQQIVDEYSLLQSKFDEEIEIIHKGHQQEKEHNQMHLQELVEERDRVQDLYLQAEQRYQDLYHTFQQVAEEEANKRVAEAASALEEPTQEVPPLLQGLVNTLEARAKQVEDKHLMQALLLKREVQSLAEQLRQERQQLEVERQQLLNMQLTAREQAQLRLRTLQARIEARWKAATIMTSLGLLALLVVLQFICLDLIHVPLVASVSFSLFAPIILCAGLSIVFAQPLKFMKHVYTSAPHKRKL